jgi:hypothetical protein
MSEFVFVPKFIIIVTGHSKFGIYCVLFEFDLAVVNFIDPRVKILSCSTMIHTS